MLRIEDVSRVWLVSLAVALLVPVLLLRSSQQKQRAKQLLGSTPVLWSTAEGNSLPFIGQGITFLLYAPWDLLTRWHERYGGVICFPLLGTTMFSVTDAQMCKAVLQSSTANIKKDIEVTMKPFLSILGTGIVTSEGSHWLKQRRKMSHPLRADILQIIPSQTLSAVQRLMTILDEAIEKGEQERVPLGSLLRHLTLQVISGSFLSLSAQESDSTFAKLYLPIVDESNKRVWHSYRSYCFFLPAFWKYHSNVYQLNAYVSSLIRQRWELRRREQKETAATASSTISSSGRSFDILDMVLADFEKEFPNHLDDALPEHAVRQFRDEMKTFMLAGHETSAAMMTWCLYEFIHNSKLCADVVREAEGVFDPAIDWRRAPSSDIPPADQLAKLQLSEASLRESLRKYSVVPIVARRVVKDLRVHGYFLPAGSSVMVNIQGIHLDPKRWPQPLKFDPNRFLSNNNDSSSITHPEPFSFLAFIAGPRNCLGQHLALLESKMVISLLCSRYQFDLDVRRDTEDWSTPEKDPRHRFMVPVIPKEEMMVSVTKRQR